MVQVCVNGVRGAVDGWRVPVSPGAMADAVVEAVGMGATDVHVHPESPCGQDTLSPRVLAVPLDAISTRFGRG